MNYEQELLNRLLDKYEESKAFLTGVFAKRISLTAAKEDWLQKRMENPEEKRLFFAVLDELKEAGLIDYSWVKFEKYNLADKIWLTPETEAIQACYRRLGRLPAREKADKLLELIRQYRGKLDAESPMSRFLQDSERQIQRKGKIGQHFADDPVLNEDLLKCLVFMERNKGEQLERLMSSALYGDSKYFERYIKQKALSILRTLKKREQEDASADSMPEDDALLLEKGIVRWPEILEFTGRLTVTLEDGHRIDYGAQTYGAYINSETVKHAASVTADGIRRVLFIENKANYVWYISQKPAGDELVILHGGCYSPIKGRWFRLVYEGCRRQSHAAEYLHWGDVDVGGFRMFRRLKEQIVPELAPYRMDRASLEQYRDQAMWITSEAYLKTLEDMENDPEYEVFREVIGMMRAERIRLEQEQMIIREGE